MEQLNGCQPSFMVIFSHCSWLTHKMMMSLKLLLAWNWAAPTSIHPLEMRTMCTYADRSSQTLMNNSFCCEFRIQWRRYIHTQYYTSDMGAFGNLSSCLHRLCHFFITQGSIAFMYELSSCWYVLSYTYYPIIFFFPSLYWTSSTGLKYTMKIVNLFNHREEVSTETKRPIYA